MSGPRQLYRDAARAAAFVRRLERSLEPAWLIAAADVAQMLLSADARLALLTRAADPFAALQPVLARVGAKPAGEERDWRQTRRLSSELGAAARQIGPADAVVGAGGLRPGLQPGLRPGGSGARARGAILAGPDDPPPAAVVSVPAGPRRAPMSTTQPRGFRGELNAVQPDPALTADVRPGAPPIRPHPDAAAAAVRGAARGNERAVPPAVSVATPPLGQHGRQVGLSAHPFADPDRAAEILVQRLRASQTLQAFRTVVRVSTPLPFEPDRPRQLPVSSRPPPAQDVRPPDRPAETGDGPSDSASRRTARESAPTLAPTARGLRRLAALATESLAEPTPGPEAAQMVPTTVQLEEQLDRILRAEALAQGIDPDGGVR